MENDKQNEQTKRRKQNKQDDQVKRSVCLKVYESDLYTVQDNYRRGKWKIPDWQRGDIWAKKKKEEFEKTILSKSGENDHLPGVFVIYNIKGTPKEMFISDGVQRSGTSYQIFQRYTNERTENYARDLLSDVSVSIQHFEYIDDSEAKTDFIRLNNGTGFTNYEQGRTVLCELTPFSQWQREVLDPIHEIVNGSSRRLGLKIGSSRSKRDKHKRDDLALFLRFVSEDQKASNYRCSSKLSLSDFSNTNKKKDLIESRLVKIFYNLGLSDSKEKVKLFNKFIEDEVALFETIWNEIDKSEWDKKAQRVTDATWRWLLACSIYTRNNKIPRPVHRKFLKDILAATRGKSMIMNKDKEVCAYKLSNLSILGIVQEYSNIWLDTSVRQKTKRKRNNISQLKSGYDDSHLKSFSRHGNGATEPAPSIDNKSQGVGYGLFEINK